MTHSCTVALNTVTKIEKTFPLSQVKPIFKRMKTKNGVWDTLPVLQPVFFITKANGIHTKGTNYESEYKNER